MNISRALNTDRILRATTGMSTGRLDSLVEDVDKCLEKEKQLRYERGIKNGERERKSGGGRKGQLETTRDKVFFCLFYFKCYPTFDLLGLIFDLDGSNACRNIHKIIPIIRKALGEAMVLPKRKISTEEELFEMFPEVHDLIIDGTERQIPRPKDKDKQKENYSGKKKRHTKKNTVIVDEGKQIRYLGPTVEGKKHDYGSFKDEFPTQPPPKPPPDTMKPKGDFRFFGDLGYTGIKKDFPWINSIIPWKTPKGGKLTEEEKVVNKLISGVRVRVEHAIGGVKRFGIISGIFRNRTKKLDDDVMEVACGLWNYYLLYP